MVKFLLAASISATIAASSQTARQIAEPKSLYDLIVELPKLVHDKRMDFGSYSEEITRVSKANPGAFSAAVPALSANLRDQDPEVQLDTVAILYGLSIGSGDQSPIIALSDPLANILSSGQESPRVLSLATVSLLGGKAPEGLVGPITAILNQNGVSNRLTLAAAETLMNIRPLDVNTQAIVLSKMNDVATPEQLRCQMIGVTANEIVGQAVTDNVISVANTSPDKHLRDCAMHAAERIGLRALTPISGHLQQVVDDPSESSDSKSIAAHALKIQAQTVQYSPQRK
jgi:hypothetical protein